MIFSYSYDACRLFLRDRRGLLINPALCFRVLGFIRCAECTVSYYMPVHRFPPFFEPGSQKPSTERPAMLAFIIGLHKLVTHQAV